MINSADTEKVYDKAKGLHKEYIPTIFSKPNSNGDILNAFLWKTVQALRPTRAIATQHDLHPSHPVLGGRRVERAVPGEKVYPDRLISPGPLHLVGVVSSPSVTGCSSAVWTEPLTGSCLSDATVYTWGMTWHREDKLTTVKALLIQSKNPMIFKETNTTYVFLEQLTRESLSQVSCISPNHLSALLCLLPRV